MATPLGTETTLAAFKAQVRSQTGTTSVQASGILEPTLTNIVHSAIKWVRGIAGKLLDVYSTSTTVTESGNLIDISALNIYDYNRMKLFDATHGEFSFKSSEEFYTLKSLLLSSAEAFGLFCHVTFISDKSQIQTYRGNSVGTAGTLTLVYQRNPTKTTTETDKLDLPESYMPIAIAVASRMVFERQGKAVPAEITSLISGFVAGCASQLGTDVTPTRH